MSTTTFTGTPTLTRFGLRRDRLRIAIWSLVLIGSTAATIPALEETFTTPAEQSARAAIMRTPAGVLFAGPGYGLDHYTLGPRVVNEWLMMLLIAVTIMNILLAVRHTRAEEESGRAELIRAGVTGIRAPGTAALLLALITNAIIGSLTAVVLIGFGLPAPDSIALGTGLTFTGLTFAAIAAVCAQLLEHARSAIGLAMAVFGLLFLMRVIGDIAEPGGTALSWLSPTSWVYQTRPYVDLRWWPLLLYVAAIAVMTLLAAALAARRDIRAGFISPRAGRAGASPLLRGMFGLNVRLQRGSILAWSAGTFAVGATFGSFANQIGELVQDNPDYAAFLGGDLDQLTDGSLAALMIFVVMLSAAGTIISVLRLRTEESNGRAETVLATPTGRWRLMGSGLAVGLVTTAATMLAGGLGMGLSAATALENSDYFGSMLLTAAHTAVIPATFGAAAALAYGLGPKLIPVVWVWFIVSMALTMFAPVLDLPGWAANISAFDHLAQYPAQPVDWTPLAIMGASAVLAATVGLMAFRRRDLTTA